MARKLEVKRASNNTLPSETSSISLVRVITTTGYRSRKLPAMAYTEMEVVCRCPKSRTIILRWKVMVPHSGQNPIKSKEPPKEKPGRGWRFEEKL